MGEHDLFQKIGFIGLGLIGGSIAKKIHTLYPDVTIIATAGHQETITEAYGEHLISNQNLCEIKDFYDCDYIFLCTPVKRNIEYLRQLKGNIKNGCIITDVGSVKTDIHEEVTALAMEDCFIGGHPMAAGLSLEEKDIDEFRRRLNADAELTEEDFVPKIWIDVPMPFEYVYEKIVQEFKDLEPFGQGNEKPLFAQKCLVIRNARVLGKNRNVVKLNLVTETGQPVDGLLFADGDRFLEEQAGRNMIDMIYYPDVNEYNGTRTLQAVIRNYKFH